MSIQTLPLKDKIALVTGGSRSIGAAIAKRLAQDGARVAITYQNSVEQANQVVQQIKALGGQAIALQADAAKPEVVRQAVAETVRTFCGHTLFKIFDSDVINRAKDTNASIVD